MSKDSGSKRRIFITVAVLALMAGVAVFTTSAAFTATTSNPGNTIEAGTVAIGDSDAGTGQLYNALNQKPGSGNGPTAACIRVTYSGSLASAVKLYRSAVTNGSAFRLTVERGSGLSAPAANMNCSGFTASSTAFDNTLDQFPTTYAGGVDGKAAGAAWSSGQSVDYRFTIYTVDDSTPNAHTSAMDTGAHSFTWEAQNN
ncbi:MAG TPA: hypothetical protein VH683_09040 [Thermoleophilaceae bacterium]|jgi:hypothetical protein